MTQVIEGATNIRAFQVLALRAAVKLEQKGLRRSRGPSAKVIACKQLGLPPRSTSYDTVLERLLTLLPAQTAAQSENGLTVLFSEAARAGVIS